MVRLARRVARTAPKDFGMVARAADAPGDVVHLELGRPSHDTPERIKEATIRALRAGEVHYGDLQGLPALREALATDLRARLGIAAGPGNVLVTNGATHAAHAAFMALLDEGQEAILLSPHYPQHVSKIELAGGRAVLAPLDAEGGFAIRPEAVEAAVTERTRVIALVNPCNPTGRVHREDELRALAEVAVRHDLAVISDEVYERIVFDRARHISIAALPGMAERTVTVMAFTKSHAMDGWRLGFAVADDALMGPLMKVATTEVTHVNSFIQHGALEAVAGPPDALAAMVEDDRRRRDLVVGRLNQMPGVACPVPEGTIYAFPDIRGTGLASREAARRILDEARVAVEAGAFYGEAGEGRLRVCFGSQPDHRLEEAMDRLGRFFNRL